MMQIKKIMSDYADAVSKVDFDKVSDRFHHHFILSTPKDLWYLANDDEFRSNLEKTFNGYKNLGANV